MSKSPIWFLLLVSCHLPAPKKAEATAQLPPIVENTEDSCNAAEDIVLKDMEKLPTEVLKTARYIICDGPCDTVKWVLKGRGKIVDVPGPQIVRVSQADFDYYQALQEQAEPKGRD